MIIFANTHHIFVGLIELGCECKPGFKQTSEVGEEFFPTCEQCPNEKPAVSQDKLTCMSCDDAGTNNPTFEDGIEDCVCPKNFYVIESAVTAIKSCSAECGVDAWPGPNDATVYSCYKCPFEG